MSARIDWSRRAGYIQTRHGIQPTWAEEAVNDTHALWLVPDPASRSGHAVRVIGYSASAGVVPTVILVGVSADPTEQPQGDWWGSNAWLANERDLRRYEEEP